MYVGNQRVWTKAEKAKYNRMLKKFKEKGFIETHDNRVAVEFSEYASDKVGRILAVRGIGDMFRVL